MAIACFVSLCVCVCVPLLLFLSCDPMLQCNYALPPFCED